MTYPKKKKIELGEAVMAIMEENFVEERKICRPKTGKRLLILF